MRSESSSDHSLVHCLAMWVQLNTSLSFSPALDNAFKLELYWHYRVKSIHPGGFKLIFEAPIPTTLAPVTGLMPTLAEGRRQLLPLASKQPLSAGWFTPAPSCFDPLHPTVFFSSLHTLFLPRNPSCPVEREPRLWATNELPKKELESRPRIFLGKQCHPPSTTSSNAQFGHNSHVFFTFNLSCHS